MAGIGEHTDATPPGTQRQPSVSGTFPNQSSTSRVLLIPELVENIFGFLNRADNARNTRVCKTWCEIALKIIWAEVDDLCALFSILAPSTVFTKEGRGNVQRFTRLPYVSDWRRFDKHARLVRKLKYTATEEESQTGMSRSLLRDISQTRIRHEIFPNLQALEWKPQHRYHSDDPNPGDGILFMHEGVKQFSIVLPSYMKKWQIEQLAFDVPLRMPHLMEISIITDIDVIKLEQPFFNLFSNLHALERIAITSDYMTNRLTKALSSLPALTQLVAGPGVGDAALWDHAQTVIPTPGFTALQDLYVKTSLDQVAQFLKAGTSSTDLRNLLVFSQSGPAGDIQQLLELCVDKFKDLYYLWMEVEQELNSDGNDLLPITFASLRALGSRSSLVHLTITHPASLSLSLADITTIVSAQPELSRLVLNPSPVHCETSAFLGLDVLPVIARHCKNLEELGLFLDATKRVAPPSIETASCMALFSKLNTCSFGVSVITKDSCRLAAAYLSTCLPGACKIEYGAKWATDGGDDPRIKIANARSGLWKEVEGLLQFLEMVRIQGRTY